jgi:hypothetical protein
LAAMAGESPKYWPPSKRGFWRRTCILTTSRHMSRPFGRRSVLTICCAKSTF